MARSMMKDMSALGWLWGEAVTTTTFILNQSPKQTVEGRTPHEVWHRFKHVVHFFPTFGCVARVKQGSKRPGKLEDRNTPIIFIGYEPGSKA
jgi:hypothetical protein